MPYLMTKGVEQQGISGHFETVVKGVHYTLELQLTDYRLSGQLFIGAQAFAISGRTMLKVESGVYGFLLEPLGQPMALLRAAWFVRHLVLDLDFPDETRLEPQRLTFVRKAG